MTAPERWVERFACADCGISTFPEYYMVRTALWRLHGVGRKMLCVGCLESRMGRQLAPEDFKDCVLTREIRLGLPAIRCSKRLRSRVTGVVAGHEQCH
jgi:hypothetical protein